MTRGLAAALLLLTATGCADDSAASLDAASAVRAGTTAPVPTTPGTPSANDASTSPVTTEPQAARTAELPRARSTTARTSTSKKSRRTGTRSTGTGRKSTSAPAPGSSQLTRLERRAMELINGHRSDHGCRPLTIDDRLLAASRAYATKMVETKHFDHTSVDGDGPSERAQRAGFPGGAAENIMMGAPDDPEGLVDNEGWGWMQSPGHRDNILNCDSTVAGIGYDPGVIDPKYAAGSWVLMLSRL